MLRRFINWWDGITGPPVAIFLAGELFEATSMGKRPVQLRKWWRWINVEIDQIHIRHQLGDLRSVLDRYKREIGRNRELILVVHKELLMSDSGHSLEQPKAHFAALLHELKAALPLARVYFHDSLDWKERLWMHLMVVRTLGPFRVLSTWTLRVVPKSARERPRSLVQQICDVASQILSLII